MTKYWKGALLLAMCTAAALAYAFPQARNVVTIKEEKKFFIWGNMMGSCGDVDQMVPVADGDYTTNDGEVIQIREGRISNLDALPKLNEQLKAPGEDFRCG